MTTESSPTHKVCLLGNLRVSDEIESFKSRLKLAHLQIHIPHSERLIPKMCLKRSTWIWGKSNDFFSLGDLCVVPICDRIACQKLSRYNDADRPSFFGPQSWHVKLLQERNATDTVTFLNPGKKYQKNTPGKKTPKNTKMPKIPKINFSRRYIRLEKVSRAHPEAHFDLWQRRLMNYQQRVQNFFYFLFQPSRQRDTNAVFFWFISVPQTAVSVSTPNPPPRKRRMLTPSEKSRRRDGITWLWEFPPVFFSNVVFECAIRLHTRVIYYIFSFYSFSTSVSRLSLTKIPYQHFFCDFFHVLKTCKTNFSRFTFFLHFSRDDFLTTMRQPKFIVFSEPFVAPMCSKLLFGVNLHTLDSPFTGAFVTPSSSFHSLPPWKNVSNLVVRAESQHPEGYNCWSEGEA